MRPIDEQRIRNEEIVRAKVQAELTRSKKTSKLWAFLNSAFGIWVLSTIVLGVFGWNYARWQNLQTRAAEIHNLDTEINARLYSVETTVGSNWPKGGKTDYYPVKLLLLPPGPDRAILPEFANRNLKSLLFDLQARVPYEEQFELVDIRAQLDALQATSLEKEFDFQETMSFQGKVHDIRESRWGWNRANRDYDHYQSLALLFPEGTSRYLKYGFFIISIVLGLLAVYRLLRRLFPRLRF